MQINEGYSSVVIYVCIIRMDVHCSVFLQAVILWFCYGFILCHCLSPSARVTYFTQMVCQVCLLLNKIVVTYFTESAVN